MSRDNSPGAALFARTAAAALTSCGAAVGELILTEDFQVGEDSMVVVLGLVGGWRGAVAFRFDPGAISASADAMAGEPVEEDDLQVEAILEAVNVVAGRGAAALAEQVGQAVWITPPLMGRGSGLQIRLMNLQGSSYAFPVGEGSAGVMFSAAPTEGGHA